MTNPKTDTKWKQKDNDREINNDREIAEVFNHYFKNKIEELKANIGQEYVRDPLEKLRNKMAGKDLRFSLKKVSEKTNNGSRQRYN